MSNKTFLIFLVFFALCCMIYLFKPFLLAIFIAILMAVATANLHQKILKFVNNKNLAPIIMTALMSLLFFAPLTYAAFAFAGSIKSMDLQLIQAAFIKIKSIDQNLPENLDFLAPKIKEILGHIDINNLSKNLLNYASNFTKSSAKFFTELILIIIFYFFANYYGRELSFFFKQLLPLKHKELEDALSEVSNVMSIVFYSVIFTAVFEGILFSICMMSFGYDGLLMGILYAITSLIPVIGGILMWVPIALYEYSQGNTLNAIIISLYSIIIISLIADTFIKPLIIKWINEKLLKTSAKINELLIFFSMIAGISSFGFWGVILGPAILALFLSVAKLYVLVVIEKEQKL